jgi:hypothetical protein
VAAGDGELEYNDNTGILAIARTLCGDRESESDGNECGRLKGGPWILL